MEGIGRRYPDIVCAHEAVIVALPDELHAVLDPRRPRRVIFKDGKLKPGPVAGRRHAGETLIVGLGNKLKTIDPANSGKVQRL